MHNSAALRRALSLVAGLAAALLAVLCIALSWFQLTVADEEEFSRVSSSVAREESFRQELADAAVQDIMDSPQVDRYLGAADDGKWYSGAVSWFKDRAEGLVDRAVSGAVDSDQFQQVWDETLQATHQENLGENPPEVLTLDVTPMYELLNEEVHSATTIDLHLADERTLVDLEEPEAGSDGGVIARRLHSAQQWAEALPALAVGALVLAGAAMGLMPHRRLIPLALFGAVTGVGAWAVFTSGAAALRESVAGLEGSGGVVARYLMDAVTANTGTWGLTSLGVGIGAGVVLLILDVLIHTSRQDTPEVH